MTKDRSQMRLERARALGVEPAAFDPEFSRQLELGPKRRERRIAAIDLERALPPQVAAGAREAAQKAMSQGATRGSWLR
jgi:hypothetical protein